jgi:CheY-like chemotaxis protein
MSIQVLVVEDNYGDAALIQTITSRSSVPVEITIAEDDDKALAILKDPKFKPDLIISDFTLPRMPGMELLTRDELKNVPVVVFSSSANPSDAREALALGAREFVQKPMDLDTEALWGIIWKWTMVSRGEDGKDLLG